MCFWAEELQFYEVKKRVTPIRIIIFILVLCVDFICSAYATGRFAEFTVEESTTQSATVVSNYVVGHKVDTTYDICLKLENGGTLAYEFSEREHNNYADIVAADNIDVVVTVSSGKWFWYEIVKTETKIIADGHETYCRSQYENMQINRWVCKLFG